MKIPPETIDRVRESADITVLIGEHVRLIKSGRSFKGLCPFHTEKTPSFMVNPDRQTYHCFGCGAGGNAITFLIEHLKMSFPEAVRTLAERAGIEIPRDTGEASREAETGPVLGALAQAEEFYQERLWHPTAGAPAREYLARRGIAEDLAREFGLGYAPEGWRHLLDAAGRTWRPEILARAGLIVSRDDGKTYDRFRGRLMIPIRNPMGRTVGFGGRALGDEEPKYLNSPESPVYQKSQILFGLREAREAVHRENEALLVEGYLDLLRLFGAGFRNTVAVSGTAFTPQQAALLTRYAARAVLVFDGDAAGVAASWRAAGLCLEAGIQVRLVTLPAGEDPDSLIRDRGAGAFAQFLGAAEGIVEFAATRIAPEQGREEALRRLAEIVRGVQDPIRRRLLVREAAERFEFDEATLVRVVESGRDAGVALQAAARPEPATVEEPVERKLIALVLAEEDLAWALDDLTEGDFHDPLCRQLLRQMKEGPAGPVLAQRLIDRAAASTEDDNAAAEIDRRIAQFVTGILAEPEMGGEKAARDYRETLRRRDVQARFERLKTQLRMAEMSKDYERSRSIRMEMSELKKGTSTTGAKS